MVAQTKLGIDEDANVIDDVKHCTCTVAAASALHPTTSPDNDTQQWVKNAWTLAGVY